jgi:hypothetical protein
LPKRETSSLYLLNIWILGAVPIAMSSTGMMSEMMVRGYPSRLMNPSVQMVLMSTETSGTTPRPRTDRKLTEERR